MLVAGEYDFAAKGAWGNQLWRGGFYPKWWTWHHGWHHGWYHWALYSGARAEMGPRCHWCHYPYHGRARARHRARQGQGQTIAFRSH